MSLCAALLLCAWSVSAHAAPASKFAPGSIQVAQACGFYAIFSCSRQRGGAVRRAARRMGGYIINTSSSAFPNFRGGFFCAVSGPKNRRSARQTSREARRRGFRTAYVKNAC
ncbi:MAG: hypothetical protein AAGF32_04445 [Pseudomonadota bacterium]